MWIYGPAAAVGRKDGRMVDRLCRPSESSKQLAAVRSILDTPRHAVPVNCKLEDQNHLKALVDSHGIDKVSPSRRSEYTCTTKHLSETSLVHLLTRRQWHSGLQTGQAVFGATTRAWTWPSRSASVATTAGHMQPTSGPLAPAGSPGGDILASG